MANNITNPDAAIKWYKDRYSTNLSDYDIYENLKHMYPTATFTENPYALKTKKKTIATEEEQQESYNPGVVEKLLTANLAGAYAEESSWWAEAYNKSIAGTIHQAIHGEARFETEDIKREWYDEAGQFFVGLISPIDILTFFGSSGVGSAAAKTITHGPLKNMATKGLSNMIGKNGFAKLSSSRFAKKLATGAGIESGFSLATYGAAGAALQDAAQQRTEILDPNNSKTEMDFSQMAYNSGKAGLHGLVLGGAAGFATKGIMAPKYAKSMMAKNPRLADQVTKLTMNPAGQVIAEGSMFGTGQTIEQALMGEDVGMDEWLSSIFMNTAIVGGLRASMKPLRLGQGDVERYKKAKQDFYGDIFSQAGYRTKGTNLFTGEPSKVHDRVKITDEGKWKFDFTKENSEVQKEFASLKNIEQTYIDAGLATPKEIIEKIGKITDEALSSDVINAEFINQIKDYNKKLSKLEDISKLSPNEQIKARADILKEAGKVNLLLNEMYREMSNNKELAYAMYGEEFMMQSNIKGGDKKFTGLSDKQKLEIDNMVQKKANDMRDVNTMLNGTVLNNPEAIKLANDKYSKGFDVNVKEVKKNGKVVGYQTEIRTPEGKKVNIGKTGLMKTRAEAEKFGIELRREYLKGFGKETKKVKEVKVDDKVEPIKEAAEVPVKGQVPYVSVNPEGLPIVGANNKPVVRYASKAEVDKMISEGTAKAPKDVNVTKSVDITKSGEDVQLSSQEMVSKITEGLERKLDVKESADIPMQKSKMSQKKADTDNLLNEVKKIDGDTKKEIAFTKPEKKVIKLRKQKPSTGKDYANLTQEAISKTSGVNRIAFVDYILNRMGGNVGKSEPNAKTGLISNPTGRTNEIAKFLIDYKKTGKDISNIEIKDLKEFFDKYIPERTSNKPSNEMSLFLEFLVREKYMDSTKGLNLKDYAKSVVTEFNEWNASGKNKNAPKKGVRKSTVEEAINSGDMGVEIAAKLGAGLYIRNSEINKLAKIIKKDPSKLNEYLKIDKESKEYYLSLDKDLAKYRTFSRDVWIPKELANDIINYINSGGSLVGKATEVGRIINKNKLSDNPKSSFYDLRRRGKSVDVSKNERDIATENYMFGHERSMIERIYNVKKVSKHIELQKELHEKLKSPLFERSKTDKEFRIDSKGDVPATKEVHMARKRKLMKVYPEMVTKLVEKFRGSDIPADAVGYLEKAERWTIKVKMGKAPSDTVPHEVSHYVFKLLDVMSKVDNVKLPKQAKKTLKLYNQAKKLFVNKDGKFVEEDAVLMIGKAIDKKLDAPMMGKVTGFFKQLNMWLKSVFNKPYTKEEIAYALGTRIIKRKGIPDKDITGAIIGKEFRKVKDFASGEAMSNYIGKNVRDYVKKNNLESTGAVDNKGKPLSAERELINFVAEEAGIQNPSEFTIRLPKDMLSQAYEVKSEKLQSFLNVFETLDVKNYAGQKDALTKLKLATKIERIRVFEKDITNQRQKEYLKSFGIKDGNIFSAEVTTKQLQSYLEYITEMKSINRDKVDWMSREDMNVLLKQTKTGQRIEAALSQTSKEEANFLFGTVHSAIERVGLKNLANRLKTHYSIQETNAAGLNAFDLSISRIIGRGILKQKTTREIKNNMWALDVNGEMLLKYKEYLNQNIPKKDKARIKRGEAFFRKAIKEEWWNTVKDGKGDNLFKYINSSTKEGQIVQSYVDNIQIPLGKAKYKSALKEAMTEAEYEAFTSTDGIKFIEDGFYFTRVFTKEGKSLMNFDARVRDKALKNLSKQIAAEEAKKRYGDNYTKENITEGKPGETIKEYADSKAVEVYSDQLHFNSGKISIRYLKERYNLQDLYMEENGKLKRTYEMDFDATVSPMVEGMAKFYATIELFPETIQGLKGSNSIEKVFSPLTKRATGAEAKQVNWVKEVVKKQLGVEKSSEPFEISFRVLEGGARIVAKLGLSFPTAGFKNVLTGTTSTIFADRLKDISRGFADVVAKDAELYNKVLSSNAYRIGNVMYEGRNVVDRFLDSFAFKLGFMKPTEKFNRFLAIAGSKYDVQRQFQRLSSFPKEHKLYKRALDRLKTRYFLTEKEIARRIKYKSKADILADKSLTKFQQAKEIRRMEVIDNKINTYAHVNTQGSSADLFMPEKAGGQWIRPLTLFKRMAYAATDNVQRNIRYSKRNKDIIRPMMGLAATYVSGSAMIQIYHHLLGTTMPDENTDWFKRFWTTMWKGEALGILSSLFSPYDNNFVETINPAITGTFSSIVLEGKQLWDGTSNTKQFGSNILKSNFSLWGNTMKIFDRSLNPLNRDRITFGKLQGEYNEDHLEIKLPEEYAKTKNSPYYKDLSSAFFGGNEEDYAKAFFATFIAVAHDLVRLKGYTKDAAFKESMSRMKSKVKSMNPNVASMYKDSKESKHNARLFKAWLANHPRADELLPRLDEIEIEYMKRMQAYNAKLKHYAAKFNLKGMIDKKSWVFKGFN